MTKSHSLSFRPKFQKMTDYLKQHRKHLCRNLLVIFIPVLLITGLLLGSHWNQELQNLTKQQTEYQTELNQKINQLQIVVTDTDKLLQNTKPESLDKPEILKDFQQQIQDAKQFLEQQKKVSFPKPKGFVFTQIQQVKTYHTKLQKDIRTAQTWNKTLQPISEQIQTSITTKQFKDAKATLDTLIQQANEIFKSSENKVADNQTRIILQDAIQKAQKLAQTPSQNLEDYQNQQTSLQQAIQQVTASIEKQNAIIQARKEAEERERILNTPWYVEYYNDYWTESAAADGSVTQWADRYFVAHSWSANGKRIASKPRYIVIDGVKYQYIDCRIMSNQVKYHRDIEPFAVRNNEIGFQTCYGKDQILVTHYERV